METTRGCFNTCAFCVSGGEKPVRTIPLEAIRERLNDIHQHGIKNVRVLDRTFNYNNKRAKELLDLFRHSKFKRVGSATKPPYRKVIRRIGRIKISLFTKEYGNAC